MNQSEEEKESFTGHSAVKAGLLSLCEARINLGAKVRKFVLTGKC